MAEAGVDNIIVHFGNSSGGTIGSKTVLATRCRARSRGRDPRCAGVRDSPTASSPATAARSRRPAISSASCGAEPRLDGYVGGSSAERFPIETRWWRRRSSSAASGCRRRAEWRPACRSASSPRSTASPRRRASFATRWRKRASRRGWSICPCGRTRMTSRMCAAMRLPTQPDTDLGRARASLSRAEAAQTMITGGIKVVAGEARCRRDCRRARHRRRQRLYHGLRHHAGAAAGVAQGHGHAGRRDRGGAVVRGRERHRHDPDHRRHLAQPHHPRRADQRRRSRRRHGQGLAAAAAPSGCRRGAADRRLLVRQPAAGSRPHHAWARTRGFRGHPFPCLRAGRARAGAAGRAGASLPA